MGSSSCTLCGPKTVSEDSNELNGTVPPHEVDAQVSFRRTVEKVEITLNDEDSEARKGILEPDAMNPNVKAEDEDRAQTGSTPQKHVSIPGEGDGGTGGAPKEVIRDEPRSKVRKGTGFVKPQDLPEDEEEDDDGKKAAPPATKPIMPATVKKRCKERKGTGFVKKDQLPVEDDDE